MYIYYYKKLSIELLFIKFITYLHTPWGIPLFHIKKTDMGLYHSIIIIQILVHYDFPSTSLALALALDARVDLCTSVCVLRLHKIGCSLVVNKF